MEERNDRGQFAKGHKKLGGRTKGSTTKQHVAQVILDIQSAVIGEYFTPKWFKSTMDKMEPDKQMDVFLVLVRLFSKVDSPAQIQQFLGLKIRNADA